MYVIAVKIAVAALKNCRVFEGPAPLADGIFFRLFL